MRKYNLGIDIGGTSIKIGLFDLNDNLISIEKIPTNLSNYGLFILSEIVAYIKTYVNIKDIRAIGIGVPGPVLKNVAISCVNLGWEYMDVLSEMKSLLNDDEIIIKVANDANLAAAGEIYKGVAKGYTNAFLVTLGTGIGGGIIVDGRVVEGNCGTAGEIGHSVVDREFSLNCNCGKSGCLETVASATGIVRLAKEYFKISNKQSYLRNVQYLSAKKVIDAAKKGDELGLEIIDKAMGYLAESLALVTYVINPDILIIGGGVSNAGEFIVERLKLAYDPLVLPFVKDMNFAIASLGNDAGIYGACYLVK
ncbi:MAG: ROK family protein [Candidatus Izemoplasmatales bacterium]|jgi:glucokinase|nr:ROK family protein [Candidatus Izemoplasmatales bacterium]